MGRFSEIDKGLVLFVLALLVGLALRLNGLAEQALSSFDEAAYILEGANIAGYEPSAPLYYARPGYVTLIAGFRLLWDDPIASARAVTLISFVASMLILWVFVGRIYGKTARNIAVIVFAVMPLNVYYGRLIYPDVLAAGLLLASIMFFLQAIAPCISESGKIRQKTQEVSRGWLLAAGFFAGYFVTVGSYRVAPVLAAVVAVCLITLFRLRGNDAKLKTKTFLAVLAALVPVVLFQVQFDFLDQMFNLAFLYPRESGTGLINVDPIYYLHVLIYFFIPVALYLVAFALLQLGSWRSGINTALSSLSEPRYQLLVVISVLPALFHTFYALRGVKLLTPSLPWIAIFFALGLARVPNSMVRNGLIGLSAILFIFQSQKVTHDMGYSGLYELADVAGQIPGVIVDNGGGWVLAVSSKTLDPNVTQLVPSWWCEWAPDMCDTEYKIMTNEQLNALDPIVKDQYEILSTHEVTMGKHAAHLSYLEGAAMPPSMKMESLWHEQSAITLYWHIVRQR